MEDWEWQVLDWEDSEFGVLEGGVAGLEWDALNPTTEES